MADVASAALARARLAEEQGDLEAVALQWGAQVAAYADPTVATQNPQFICYAAVTYEMTGQPAKAQTTLDAPQKAVGAGTFVDFYRLRGDVLMKQNQPKEALAKYDAALKYAPNWKQLKEARAAAAKL